MIKWTKRGQGYFEGVGYSKINLTLRKEDLPTDGFHWSLYAGDKVTPRARATTFGKAKTKAELMFG